MKAARVGLAWFPIHLFDAVRAADIEASRLSWRLDEDGRSLEWTDEPWAADREDPRPANSLLAARRGGCAWRARTSA